MANTEPFLFFWKRVETKERKLLSVALGTYFKHHLLTFTGPARQDSALIELKEKWWPKVGSNWGPDADSQKGIQLCCTALPALAGEPNKTLGDDWACKLGCKKIHHPNGWWCPNQRRQPPTQHMWHQVRCHRYTWGKNENNLENVGFGRKGGKKRFHVTVE